METLRDVIQPRAVKAQPAFRSPRRITITVPYGTDHRLLERSEQEGRSLSNLAAHLLENAMDQPSLAFLANPELVGDLKVHKQR